MKTFIFSLSTLVVLYSVFISSAQATSATISFTILANTGHNKVFSQEFVDAYNFAYEKGITTQKTIQDADVEGKLTRAHMAKMMTTYAIKVMSGIVNT